MAREVVELESNQQYTKTVQTTSDFFFQGDAFFIREILRETSDPRWEILKRENEQIKKA